MHPGRELTVLPAHRAPQPAARAAVAEGGPSLTIRTAGPADEPALRRMLEGLSPHSLSSRFLGTPDLGRAARSLATLRPGDLALVAETDAGELVAHGAAYRVGRGRGEVAFLVADEWQGRGIAGRLLALLAHDARGQGLTTLVADVLPSNRAMLTVFARCAMPLERHHDGDVVSVSLTLTVGEGLALAA